MADKYALAALIARNRKRDAAEGQKRADRYVQQQKTAAQNTPSTDTAVSQNGSVKLSAGVQIPSSGASTALPAATQAQIAKKAYDTYTSSEEYQQRQRENNRVALREAMERIFSAPGTSASDMPLSMVSVKPEDTKERGLKAAADHYERQMEAEEDRQIMDADLRELDTWSDDDKRLLQRYITERDQNQRDFMAGPQFDTYNLNPLLQKYGEGKVKQMAESYQRSQNAQTMRQTEEAAKAYAEEHPVLGSVASVGTNLAGSVTGPVEYLREMGQRTGRYSTLDPNNIGNLPAAFGSGARQQAAQIIAGDEYDENGEQVSDGGWVRQLGAYGFQGAMSAADSLARLVFGGGKIGSLGLAATGSFGQTLSEASRQGATPAQAALLAVGSAALEVGTEFVPLDEMLKAAKGGTKGALAIAGKALKQAGIEATTEEISLFGNLLLEAAVLQNKSAYQQQIGDLVANGASYEEAKQQADQRVWNEALQTAAVSGFSGGFSSAGSAAMGGVLRRLGIVDAQQEGEDRADATAPAADEGQRIIEATGEQLAQNMPPQEVPVPLTEGQRHFDNAAAIANGIPPAQMQTVEDASTVINNGQKETAPSLSGDAEAYRVTSDNATKSGAVPNNSMPENGVQVNRNLDSTQQTDNIEQSAEDGHDFNTGAVPANAPGGQRDLTEQNPGTVGAMQSQFKHEVKQSKVYGNTYQNTPYADVHDIGRAAKKADPNIDQYDVITEAESVHEAELRTEAGRDRLAEHRALMKKDGWTGADNDTAMRLLTVYRREGKKDRFLELSRKQRQMGTQAGQMAQSFAKYSREDATVAVQDAIADLDELTIDQVDRTFWKPKQETKGAQGKKDAFQKWKESITGSLLEVANDIENVEDGDKAAMKDLVRQIANLRHTTAWAGYSSDLSRRTERGLDKMDFDTLKTVAKTQLSMIPNDFRKRDTGEILKQIRVQNMLFTLTTKFKNDAGNITNGIMDAISDSFGGRMIDAVIGKWTGKRTVGNDLKYAAEYNKAARDAADVASAFVSLDIPMEVAAKYSSGRTRTWTPNATNVFGRLMSAYEKHLKYALEVSDKFYEGGVAHVVNKSLQNLGEKSGLTPEQIQDIAQKTGERRTFKDPGASVDKSGQPKNGRMLARANVGLQKALNNIGTENIGLGDMVMPFAAVSGEVKQVGMDYTGGGLISGMKEIISIAKDVRNGKEIDPYRQRTAATNFGRGMTGVGLIAAFTAFAAAGAVKVHNDRDSEERMMNQTQGLSGAQWNLNSSLRWWEATMNGSTPEEAAKAAEWQSGDELITIDFLEPYNTQMHIGYLLSQGEDIPTAIMQGNFNSLLEMPMMQTLSDLADLQQAFTEVSDGDMDGVRDAAGQLVGTVAGSIVPNWMRKIAQVIDPYYRDTYDTNPFRKAAKEVVAAAPILSAALPEKYDNLGKEQRRFDESEWMAATFDNLVTPWDTDTYQTNPVYQEIERLDAIDGINVTPPQAKRKITYTDSTGKEHENYNLSSEQYETMQKVQGQTAEKILNAAIQSEIYKAMTDAQKAKVFEYVYDYARETARAEALPGYEFSGGWMDAVTEDDPGSILQKVVGASFTDAFDTYVNGGEGAGEALEQALTVYETLPKEHQKQLAEDTGGRVEAFLEANNAGVGADTFLELYGQYREISDRDQSTTEKANAWSYALENAQDAGKINASQERILKSSLAFRYSMQAQTDKFDTMVEWGIPQEKALDMTELLDGITQQTQKAQAIVQQSGLTEQERRTILRVYLSDAQDKNLDEMQDMGYDSRTYAKVLEIYSSESGTGKKDRVVQKIMNVLGVNRATAEAIYKVYG